MQQTAAMRELMEFPEPEGWQKPSPRHHSRYGPPEGPGGFAGRLQCGKQRGGYIDLGRAQPESLGASTAVPLQGSLFAGLRTSNTTRPANSITMQRFTTERIC